MIKVSSDFTKDAKSCGGFHDGMCRANGPVTLTDRYTTIIYEQKKGIHFGLP